MAELTFVEPIIGSVGQVKFYRCVLSCGQRVVVGEMTLYNAGRFAQAAQDQLGKSVNVAGDWTERVNKAKEPLGW